MLSVFSLTNYFPGVTLGLSQISQIGIFSDRYITTDFLYAKLATQTTARKHHHHHHHHHHGAERSAVASRRCDLSPKRSVLCQLESISHRYSRVPADLMDPCGERSTSSTPPVGWWPDTVLSFAAGLEDLGTSSASLATCPNSPSLRLRTIDEAGRRPVQRKTSSLVT